MWNDIVLKRAEDSDWQKTAVATVALHRMFKTKCSPNSETVKFQYSKMHDGCSLGLCLHQQCRSKQTHRIF